MFWQRNPRRKHRTLKRRVRETERERQSGWAGAVEYKQFSAEPFVQRRRRRRRKFKAPILFIWVIDTRRVTLTPPPPSHYSALAPFFSEQLAAVEDRNINRRFIVINYTTLLRVTRPRVINRSVNKQRIRPRRRRGPFGPSVRTAVASFVLFVTRLTPPPRPAFHARGRPGFQRY